MRSRLSKTTSAIFRRMKGPRAFAPPSSAAVALACVVVFAMCFLPTALAAQEVPSDIRPRGLPPALRDVGFEPQLSARLPLDLKFRDETGAALPLGNYFRGKPVVLAFVYYGCPMLCNQIQVSLVGALKMISFSAGNEYDVVLVSFDPRETPAMAAAKKREAVERYGRAASASGWHFLTGNASSIDSLTRAANFRYSFDEQKKLFAHASGILILTPDGRISRYFFGIDFPPRDIRLALVEASDGKIGTPADRLTLFCYAYDPATARYSAMIVRLVQAGGLLVIASLVAAIVIFRKRELAARSLKSVGAD